LGTLAANLHSRSRVCRQLSPTGRQPASNSLFRNILRISTLNSKIWQDLFCKSMIPKDRDIRGRGLPISSWLVNNSTTSLTNILVACQQFVTTMSGFSGFGEAVGMERRSRDGAAVRVEAQDEGRVRFRLSVEFRGARRTGGLAHPFGSRPYCGREPFGFAQGRLWEHGAPMLGCAALSPANRQVDGARATATNQCY
jgi:hypothetical protein